MEDLKTIITELVKSLKGDIGEFYKIYEAYLTDLILSKNINVSLIIDSGEPKDAKKNIHSIITVINSALITIGVSKNKLTADTELYQDLFEKNKSSFSTYLSFLQLGLKDYINKHLFIIILEYLIDSNSKIIENLDLFDILPHEFRNKLTKLRKESKVSGKIKKHLKIFNKDLLNYFNPSELTFKSEDFQIEDPMETISEEDILKKLQEARQENIEAITQTSNQLNNDILRNKGKTPSFLNYFVSFPKLNQSITNKIKINIKQLRKFISSSPEFLDLENLFYMVNIFKMLGEEVQLEPGYVKNVVNNFISGKVFSTGKYHKPNSISISHGLSVLFELDLLSNSELVDLLDIEMFLENELNPLIPEKLFFNFYTILSLKMLKKSGGIITNKSHLIEPLVNLDLFKIEGFKPSSDMFFYLGLLKLLDDRIDFNAIRAPYLIELEKQMLPNGSVNGNITDTARTLLTLVLLDSTGKEISIISELLKFLNQNLKFFTESQDLGDFTWDHNKIAFKIELRMLFWMLLALSQYS
ncbi:MAG: hypothetical protein HWN80_05430 [Candidatus Lokiarchaeota archaeon]|nr:hypothetical protein [Candidatus Lokiarchaeota archaeon]